MDVNATLTNVSWSVYENNSYGIKLDYHNRWDIVETGLGEFGIVKFISPETKYGRTYESLTIHRDPGPLVNMNQTLEQYAEQVIDWYKASYIANPIQIIDRITLTTLSGKPAYNYSFIQRGGPPDSSMLRTLEVGTMVGNDVFYIQYLADEYGYLRNLPTVQKMLDSIEFDETISSASSSSATNNTDIMYLDEITGASITYPSAWQKVEGSNANFVSTLGSIYLGGADFYAPLQGRLDPVPDSISLLIEELPSNVTLEAYANETETILKESIPANNGTNYELVEFDSNSTFHGNRAHKILATYTIQGINYKVMDFMFKDSNKIYFFNLQTEASQYDYYLPIAERMLTSLDIRSESRSEDAYTTESMM